jgi:hypothetical protein
MNSLCTLIAMLREMGENLTVDLNSLREYKLKTFQLYLSFAAGTSNGMEDTKKCIRIRKIETWYAN